MVKKIGKMLERLDYRLIKGRISEKNYKKLRAKYNAQLELQVYKHIKRHRGELDVEKCAKKLGVSEEDVEKAAEALVTKGKLEQEE